MKDNIETSAEDCLDRHEWKQRVPWCDEERFRVLDQRKQAKIQRSQDPIQNNVDNVNNVKTPSWKTQQGNKKKYLEDKLINLKLSVR
jgi:hypothetical protein